ncbi:helix-turn-helix domain-containing protein [Streptomyces sp. NPDC005917]|uniref:helix-turn-helix domain-containing protein n=1 Tax=unclassified Streptomyces TaxID=2593676 RepID=UPI0033EAC3E0
MGFNVLGLTADMERVYTALVGMPRSTTAEVADACGMAAPTAGKLLSGLVRDGLAVRTAGRPLKFSAAAPDVAVSALINEREQELGEARALVQRLLETHREATRISHPDMAAELLTDRDDISKAVHRLTTGARREVCAFDRPPYVDRPGSNLDAQVERQQTGVTYRVIYDREAVAWPGRLQADIMPSMRAGEQARMRPELPLKLVISDSRAAIIPFSLAPGGQSAAYLIHPSPMLVALQSLFEAQWERAIPLGEAAQQPDGPTSEGPGHPDAETRALVSLLASGLTDAAIARTQGWSARTTQRRIHRLMSELGASTRFQTGLAAARRGWL